MSRVAAPGSDAEPLGVPLATGERGGAEPRAADDRVRLNDFARQWAAIRRDAIAAFERVGASGWYVLGREVETFEAALAQAWPAEQVVGTGNGLDALEIALRCLEIGPGDRVLTTPLSAFASTLAILRVGATPVFVDVDAAGLLDLERCRRALSSDSGVRALLVVHLYGHSVDLDMLERLRGEYGLHLVEDCAQSIASRWNGRATGTVGQVAATSFYPTKNLGALGDAGAVLCSSSAIADKARSLRHYGQVKTYQHDDLGLNSRLDEIHAAVLRDALLPHLDAWTVRRSAIATHYLSEIESPWLELPHAAPAGSAWHLFPVLVAEGRRGAFVDHLAGCGVMTGIHYPRLITEQRALLDNGDFEVVDELERATRFARQEVSLPIHPFLEDSEIDRVVASINAWKPL